jgi:hypothetical protein
MFKTHQKNIPQIKAAIIAYGEVWVHGCGNMYANDEKGKKASDDRQKYSNPDSEEATYRILFTDVKQVPATKEALDKKLMASRNQEMITDRANKVSTGVKTIRVEEEPTPDASASTGLSSDDAELQRLIDEENAKKGK